MTITITDINNIQYNMVQPYSTGQVTGAFVLSNVGEQLAKTPGTLPLSESDRNTMLQLLRLEPGKKQQVTILDSVYMFTICPRHSVLVGKSKSTVVLGIRGDTSTLIALTDVDNALLVVSSLRAVIKHMTSCHL